MATQQANWMSGDKIIEVKVSGTQTNAGNAENVPHNAKICGNGTDKTKITQSAMPMVR